MSKKYIGRGQKIAVLVEVAWIIESAVTGVAIADVFGQGHA